MRKNVIYCILASALIVFVLAFALIREFSIRSEITANLVDLPTIAIVFTGQFDRVELALQLFDQGRLDRVFISGVNGGAGITPQGFAEQFQLTSLAGSAPYSGEIVLATEADTTIQNALETACWLDKHPNVHEIVLITEYSHMPRASWALERALSGTVSVERLSPNEPDADNVPVLATVSEILKFGATISLTLLPRNLWPGVRQSDCL